MQHIFTAIQLKRSKLGMESEDIDEVKLVEIDRLNKKKIELEQKLKQMESIIEKAKPAKKERSLRVANFSNSKPLVDQ